MSRLLAGLALAALCFSLSARAAESSDAPKPLLTILYSGEAHAALLPCDCPLQPLGGVARRATLIKRYRERGPVLLVDTGGWAAGGIYDEDSDGDPARDKTRSDLMAKAMKLMGYDFFAVGPQEAEYAGEPLAPGRPALAESATAAVPGSILSVLVAGWSEPGTQVLGKTAPLLPGAISGSGETEKNVLRLGLSRLGEEHADALARTSGADVIINAGRKTSQRVSWHSGRALVANFDYESRQLGVIEIFPARPADKDNENAPRFDIRVHYEPLTAKIPDDPAVAELLKPYLKSLKKTVKKRVEIEYWTMPECPGCAQLLPTMEQLAADLNKRADVSVHFVLNKDGGKFTSLHGTRELEEARVQALIQKHYPGRIWSWLAWRETHRDTPWQEGAKQLGLLAARLRGGLDSGEADELLNADYELMQRRHVDGTPTLVISNRIYDGPLERLQILRVLCAMLQDPKPAACKDVPACFFDAQCRKRGYIGKCIDPGKAGARCDFSRKALAVPGIVIADREAIQDNHEAILEILRGDLPGLEYRVLDFNDPEARELIAKAKISRLPAYLLDPVAQKESGYAESVGKAARLDEATKRLVLQPFTVGAQRLAGRTRVKGRVDLFVSRFGKSGQEAVDCALDYLKNAGATAPRIVFHDALYWKKSEDPKAPRELAASGGLPEIEEAARALAVKQLAPEKYLAYLAERGKRRAGSYWDVPLKTLGIDPEKVRALAEGPAPEIVKELHAEADFLAALDAGGEITVLAENCEIIPVRSRAELRQILDRVAERKREAR